MFSPFFSCFSFVLTPLLSLFFQTYLTEKAKEETVGEKKVVEAADGMVLLKSKAERTNEDVFFVGKSAKKEKRTVPEKKPVKKVASLIYFLKILSSFCPCSWITRQFPRNVRPMSSSSRLPWSTSSTP